jgi:membrane protease YdiL (CAAX protease family)
MEKQPSRPSLLRQIFLTPTEPRLRAGWRLAGQYAFQWIGYVLVGLAIVPISTLFPNLFSPENIFLAGQLATFVITLAAVFLARRLLDRRSIASLGLKWNSRALVDLLAGILFAALAILLIFSLEWVLGWVTIQGFVWQVETLPRAVEGALVMLVLFILIGYQEELLYRGYKLQNLVEGMNLPWGVAISIGWFASEHWTNPNFSWQALIGLCLAGIFLTYPTLRTRQLWLSIGLHIGWNFFISTVFGFTISGLNLFRLTLQEVHGPPLFTGGKFGPEAGLILLPAGLLILSLTWIYTRHQATPEKSLASESSPVQTPTS